MVRRSSILVNVEAIASLSYDCHGCTTVQECCCSRYNVCLTRTEMETVIGMLPEAAKFCPALKEDNSFANVFEETEDGCYVIDKDENDSCVFAFTDDSIMRCALHTAAVLRGLSPYGVKPSACLLWPLAISNPPNQFLSISDDALDLPCCFIKRKAESYFISQSLQEIVKNLFGEEVCQKIINAARKGEKETAILL